MLDMKFIRRIALIVLICGSAVSAVSCRAAETFSVAFTFVQKGAITYMNKWRLSRRPSIIKDESLENFSNKIDFAGTYMMSTQIGRCENGFH